MYAGTTQLSGRMAGAARPVTCAALLAQPGYVAPMHEHTWLNGSNGKSVSPGYAVFTIDRPTRRLSERSP